MTEDFLKEYTMCKLDLTFFQWYIMEKQEEIKRQSKYQGRGYLCRRYDEIDEMR